MKVLITHSYFYQMDPKQWNNRTPYPPLATITAFSHLKQYVQDLHFYDVALDPDTQGCIETMDKLLPNIVVFYEDGFNYLTKMCLTNMRLACFDMIKHAKEQGATVIVSSSDATDHYKDYHEKGADFIIHGEGEITLQEVVQAIQIGEDPSNVAGISYLKDCKAIKTTARQNLKDLDVLPIADWTQINIERYRSIWSQGKFPFTLNIATTRGCPFKCNWCAKPIYGNRYNSRTPKHVLEELSLLNRTYGVNHFWMADDIFGLKPGWVHDFNELIQEEGLKIKYKIQSRADLLLKDETIDELASSGLEEVWIGAESGSQKILDAMDKGTTLEQIKSSTQLLQEKGVRVAYFLQFGYLGETQEDINATLKMVNDNRPDDIGISVSYPLPGTPFYTTVLDQMGEKQNWKDSDDLDLMYQGSFSSAYYRALQRYVHHRFRAKMGWLKLIGKKPDVTSSYIWKIPYNLVMKSILKIKLSSAK